MSDSPSSDEHMSVMWCQFKHYVQDNQACDALLGRFSSREAFELTSRGSSTKLVYHKESVKACVH